MVKTRNLVLSAEITLHRLSKTDENEFPGKTLTDLYEVLHQYLDAYASSEGKKTSGEGAHKDLIGYALSKHVLQDTEANLMNELRLMRNRIIYDGYHLNPSYLINRRERIQQLLLKLKSILT